MTTKIKSALGDAGAGIDSSYEDTDTLRAGLAAAVTQLNDLTAQYNQLKADHDSATAPTSATDVVVVVEVE